MKRIALEEIPCSADRGLLRVVQPVETTPEFLDGAILVVHARGGGSESAVSIGTKRPFSKSSSASMKSCGISSPGSCRICCARRSRSDAGSARISSRICSAVILSEDKTGKGLQQDRCNPRGRERVKGTRKDAKGFEDAKGSDL